jgi:NAD(P)-dependent dehydrogenase (short-subunit alcohol dehydrogenase family)
MEPFTSVSQRDMARIIEGSLILPLECARRYAQDRANALNSPDDHGTTDHHSTIIFIGSFAQDHPFTHCTSYCAAKAGLDMAVRCLAWELAPEGFHVHIIHPNHVSGTPMTDQVRKGMMEGVHKMTQDEATEYQLKDLGPRMGRLLTPDDIAQMVVLILDNPIMGWLAGNGLRMYGSVR